ncbi:MAG: bifunctional folylpolyglutamate synthase/dihydrofolate synthase [Proteobacteria bacterium]|nr:bifunctional folylpolyglutamate synthase/dihydrofolate synthase [Pseudomonadota bacterium]
MSEKIEQWLAQYARPPSEINLGLAHLQQVRQQMQLTLPQPLITVGGTNGKGSVCHLLAAILTAAGFRVGCYSSPHIFHFSERIKICDIEADNDLILQALITTSTAAQAANAELTYFELTTLAAAHLFAAAACDIVILEVGLGGRLDAVNLFDADVAVITNIGIDHIEFLGDTRDKIAIEKAGIGRADKPLVVGDPAPPPALMTTLAEKKVNAYYIGQDFSAEGGRFWNYNGRQHRFANLPQSALTGAHQRENAATALCALECLAPEYWPGSGAIRRGLHTVALPGRAQILPGQPVTVLDVAHNTAAAIALEQQLFDMGYFPRTTAVFGMLARKDIDGFVGALNRRIDHWHVVQPTDGDLSAAALAERVRSTGAAVTAHDTIAAAVRAAHADSGDNGRIVITGSFLTVSDFLLYKQNG